MPAFGLDVEAPRLVAVTAFVGGPLDAELADALDDAHTEMLADWEGVARREPEVRFSVAIADRDWRCLFEVGRVFVGPVCWDAARAPASSRAALARELLAIGDALRAPDPSRSPEPPSAGGPSADGLSRVLRDATAAVAGAAFREQRGLITVAATSADAPGATLAAAALPARHETAVDLLVRIARAARALAGEPS